MHGLNTKDWGVEMLLDKEMIEYKRGVSHIPEYTKEEKRYAALLVYLKWSYIERFGYEPNELEDRFDALGINLSRFEACCAWCELFRSGIADGLEARTCTIKCPLVRAEQHCFMTMSWFNCVSMENRYKIQGDNYPKYMTGKVAAGNIAALAWKEYKRLGG